MFRYATLLFVSTKRGRKLYIKLFRLGCILLVYTLGYICIKTSFYINFMRLKTKIIVLLINKVFVLSSTKRGRLLIQISPKNVIYILTIFAKFC